MDPFEQSSQGEHVYCIPEKAVKTHKDLQLWERSEAYYEYMGFIQSLNEAVQGKSSTIFCEKSSICNNLISLLGHLDKMIDNIPPIDQPQRFGNQAFRTWYNQLKETALDLLQEALPEEYYSAIAEIMVYLVDGFGNSTRIDYGTGHEISFLMFLCCTFKIGALKESDKVGAVTGIFNKYLAVVRKLQLTYRMEPAGSHGVWSLDDYQFVPFIWGSSQLYNHPVIEPARFVEDEIINTYHYDYMFIGCINFIRKVKTGQFAEHSNQLWSISGVSNWQKINAGLIKMYKKEILGKFPVVQHIVFGSLLPFKEIKITPRPRYENLNYKPPITPPSLSVTSSTVSDESTLESSEPCRCRDGLPEVKSPRSVESYGDEIIRLDVGPGEDYTYDDKDYLLEPGSITMVDLEDPGRVPLVSPVDQKVGPTESGPEIMVAVTELNPAATADKSAASPGKKTNT